MFEGCTSLKVSATYDPDVYRYSLVRCSGIQKKYSSDGYSTYVKDMFKDTGGAFTGTPAQGTMYYTDHEPAVSP